MKILQVISSFPPAYDYGGPPRSAYHLSASLVDRGHEVTVFTTDALDAENRVEGRSNPEVMDGIKIYRFRNLSNSLSWRNLPLAPGMWRALHRHLNEFDIVHTHEFRSFQTWFAHWAAKSTDVSHVLQPRGSVPRESKSRQKWVFDTVFGEQLLAEANQVIVSSESEASQFDGVRSIEEDRITKVPNGIDIEKFDPPPDEGTFRQEYDIHSNVPVILFLSRLHERKGGDILVSAFADLRNMYPDSMLVFVGPDEGARESLERQVNDLGLTESVLFTGPLYEDDKLAAYRDADVFVLPSKDRHESFGNVVLEALACGTSTVVTDVCGVTEYLHGRFSTTVEPSDCDIEAGIQELIAGPNPDTKDIISFLDSELSWMAVAKETELVYRSLLKTEDTG